MIISAPRRSSCRRLGSPAAFAFAAMLALAGCSLAGGDDAPLVGEVTGEADPEAAPPALVLRNETNRTAHYVTVERSDGARTSIQFPPCEERPAIPAGETARVPYEEIALYDAGDEEAWVRWCVPGVYTGASFYVSLQ